MFVGRERVGGDRSLLTDEVPLTTTDKYNNIYKISDHEGKNYTNEEITLKLHAHVDTLV